MVCNDEKIISCGSIGYDEYTKKSKKIIVPYSITAKSFYLKLSYKSKYSSDNPNEDGLFILEKSRYKKL